MNSKMLKTEINTMRFQLIFALCILCVVFKCCAQKKAEDAIYIIPKGFEGNLLIVFNKTNGSDSLYEDGKRVYVFNNTGILETKFGPNYGTKQNFYFYGNRNGKRSSLKYLYGNKLTNENEVVVHNRETGKMYNQALSRDVYFEISTVGKQKNIFSIEETRSSFLSSAGL